MGYRDIMELAAMKETLQNALDDIASTHSSSARRSRALRAVEELIATTCSSKGQFGLDSFMALQDDFECNVPSRLLPWISRTASFVGGLSLSDNNKDKLQPLSSHLAQSLTIIQGIALNHKGTKVFLGRKYALEVLLDVLLVSRHTPSVSAGSITDGPRPPLSIPLASVVLDTLLCILVDSPLSIRAFEASKGVEVVVKILKHPGIPREVRMKCLEFLYFYLLDEAPQSSQTDLSQRRQARSLSPKKGNQVSAQSPPLERHSDDISLARASSLSTHGVTSFISIPLVLTCPDLSYSAPTTPPGSPKKRDLPRSDPLAMLRKEVEFVPTSLVKTYPSVCSPHAITVDSSKSPSSGVPRGRSAASVASPIHKPRQGPRLPFITSNLAFTRTTEEKKEILGHMLGNVDALVEGVRKSGIWGLQ